MKPQSSRISFVFCISFIASLTTAEQTDKIRVACVGDSITFGAGVKERNKNSYPKVLAGLLGEKYDVRNFGVNGATLLKKGNKPWWKLRAFKDATAFKPNVVIIKLGTTVLAFNEDLEILWTYTNPWDEYTKCPAYIPSVGDIDGDGKDEVNGGYFLLDDDGSVIWEEQLGRNM